MKRRNQNDPCNHLDYCYCSYSFPFLGVTAKTKYWYLGGIVPVAWVGIVIFLFVNGMIRVRNDWKMLLFPTVILILIWISGHESAKKKEMNKMKAKDM